MKTKDFDFELPSELIAQMPITNKAEIAMLVFNNDKIFDKQLKNIVDYLQEGDVLVFNNAKVIKAKFSGEIQRNQAKLDVNLDQEINDFSQDQYSTIWQALCKPAKKVIIGDILKIADNFFAEIIDKDNEGFIKLKFNLSSNDLVLKLEKYGQTPIPPYIKRTKENLNKNDFLDQENYQTIYAKSGKAVACPTAGLHFSEEIFLLINAKKIKQVFVTLDVGAGTFLPVRSELISDHKMHQENYIIDVEACKIINDAKKNNQRIIAIGTTALRVLESSANDKNLVEPKKTSTNIFITPPYNFKIVDILLTNFHLPKSTLFMLICAFVGKENAHKIYQHAIKNRYRFFSYGDPSLLFRK
jgi:S-adenosylmethionine:tRNA ribosyltransferase-isomerase